MTSGATLQLYDCRVQLALWTSLLLLIGYCFICSALPSRLDPKQRPKSLDGLLRAHVEGLGESVKGTDLIFVHGLGANPDTTWSARNDSTKKPVNWVTDLLPQSLSRGIAQKTRIFFFNYDSNWRRDALKTRLNDLSRDLLVSLTDLMQANAAASSRSIILIAHSYGGLVVKKMITEMASCDREHLPLIKGVLFLGCPHRGSALATGGRIAALLFTPVDSNASVFLELTCDGDSLRDLGREYHQATSGTALKTVNFFERRPTKISPFYRTVVVTKHSATYDNDQSEGLPVDHYGLNKFSSTDAPGYAKLRDRIVSMLEDTELGRAAVAKTRRVMRCHPVATFVQRWELYNDLDQALSTERQTPDLAHGVAVIGPGGTGKTQLVIQYVEDHVDAYDAVLWLDARTKQTVRSSCRICCHALDLAIPGGEDRVESLEGAHEVVALLSWLRSRILPGQEWLVVIDNADDLTWNLQAVVPRGKRGSVILTSRDRRSTEILGLDSPSIAVDSMSLEESTLLLKRGIGRSGSGESKEVPHKYAELIVDKLDRLALAIDLAGAYIRTHCEDGTVAAMQQYLADFERHREKLLKRDDLEGLTGYDKTIWTVWNTSLEQVAAGPQGALSVSLLVFLTSFDRTCIQEYLFEFASLGFACLGPTDCSVCPAAIQLPDWLAGMLAVDENGQWDSYLYRTAMRSIERYHLIRRTGDGEPTKSLSMHALIHWRAEQERQGEQWLICHAFFIAAVCHYLGTESANLEKAKLRRTVLSHIRSQQEFSAYSHMIDDRERHIVYHTLGLHFFEEGWLRVAKRYFVGAVNAASAWSGLERTEGQESLTLLAQTNVSLRRWHHAVKQYRILISVGSRELGEEHPMVLVRKAKLANVYREAGDLDEAVDRLEEVVQQAQKSLGAEDGITTTVMADLASLYMDLGRVQEAHELSQQVYRTTVRLQGPGDPATLAAVIELAKMSKAEGRLEKAEGELRDAHQQCSRHLGTVHVLTQRCTYILADILIEQDRYQEALPVQEEYLRNSQVLFGPTHPENALAYLNLAFCLWYCRRREEAEDAIRKARDLANRVLGPMSGPAKIVERYIKQMEDADEVGCKLVTEYLEQDE